MRIDKTVVTIMNNINIRISYRRLLPGTIAILLILAATSGCRQLDVYEKNTTIPGYQWKYSFQPEFDFKITDTASPYQLLVVLRHTDAYRYNNIWLNITGIYNEKDTLVKLPHLELPLGNDEKGWEGTGMNDIWEVRKPVSNGPLYFSKPGNYRFRIAQIMRDNPLPHILSIGMRVEKIRRR